MHTEDRLASFQHSAQQPLAYLPRPRRNQLLDGAADVRFRGDAIVLRECLVDPNEPQLAIGEPDPDRRRAEGGFEHVCDGNAVGSQHFRTAETEGQLPGEPAGADGGEKDQQREWPVQNSDLDPHVTQLPGS